MKAIVQHRCLFTAILGLVVFFYVQVQANEQVSTATTLQGYHEFDYKFKDRPDPFLPFLDIKPRPDRLAPEEGKLIDPKQILTKLQKFEPGQLKLVAVLAFQDKKIAMLEDVTGKGHLVEQDTLIGRHGVVTSIEKDRLLVTETYQTQSERTVVNKIPLYMHQQD
ncbi:pilus assembly protein PilP [Desulfobulbus sp. TB]|nr:pilus assembly protein PilP [Desulfobulbus sp. TB]